MYFVTMLAPATGGRAAQAGASPRTENQTRGQRGEGTSQVISHPEICADNLLSTRGEEDFANKGGGYMWFLCKDGLKKILSSDGGSYLPTAYDIGTGLQHSMRWRGEGIGVCV